MSEEEEILGSDFVEHGIGDPEDIQVIIPEKHEVMSGSFNTNVRYSFGAYHTAPARSFPSGKYRRRPSFCATIGRRGLQRYPAPPILYQENGTTPPRTNEIKDLLDSLHIDQGPCNLREVKVELPKSRAITSNHVSIPRCTSGTVSFRNEATFVLSQNSMKTLCSLSGGETRNIHSDLPVSTI